MSTAHQQIDPELLALLACPACHGTLTQHENRLICQNCQRRYPIEDGIPVLLVEEAEQPEDSTP